MEFESSLASGLIGIGVAVLSRAAWNGIKRRNGCGNALESHNDSATAHPDLRAKLGKIEATTLNIYQVVNRIESGMRRLTPEDEE